VEGKLSKDYQKGGGSCKKAIAPENDWLFELAIVMQTPVCKLPYIMPIEELMYWKARYEYGKFGKKLNDYRFATQAKLTDLAFSDGKINPPLEKYIPKIEMIEEKATQCKNLILANAFLGGNVVPKEILKNVYSSKPDSPSEA